MLQQALDAADAAIRRWTKRAVLDEQTITTLYLSGNGIEDLILPHYPITSIASVSLDSTGYGGTAPGAFPAATLLTAGVDYYLVQDGDGTVSASGKSGRLRRLGGGTGGPLAWSEVGGGYRGRLAARQAPFWPRGYDNVKLTGVKCGYNPVPADLIVACNELAAWTLRSGALGGRVLSSESQLGYSFSLQALATRPELGEVRSLLTAYRQVSVGS